MAALLIEALKGARDEVTQQQGLLQRVRRAGRLTGVLAQELRAAVGLSPFGVRAVRVRSALPTAGSSAAAAGASPFGVVLHPAVPYGPHPRHKLDIYVPSALYQMQQQQQQQQQQDSTPQQQQLAPVVFFVHGGIWVTGERWHFAPLATRLAQAGLVVVVPSYTLYPDALAGQMAAEVLAAYKWTAQHAAAYGGQPERITVLAHSAGGHLGSLALMMLAQQKHLAHTQQQQQGQQQQQQQHARHLPDQQLQQRDALAAAQASHHHNTCHSQHLPAEQQQPQQQLQQQEGLHWAGSGPHVLAVPRPWAFIGMSSIYDGARHFEFESLRGVAGISTMARAWGGAVAFDAISPACVLRRAAAAAAAAASSGAGSGDAQGHQQQRQQRWEHSGASQQRSQQQGLLPPAAAAAGGDGQPALLGELIPLRSGLEGRGGAHLHQAAAAGGGARADCGGGHHINNSSVAGVPPAVAYSTSALLATFSVAAARHMPPCILMSSIGDHMVPWHEAAEMCLALRSCGVPAKHLIYDTAQHNDFVLDWSPARAGGGGGAAAVADAGTLDRHDAGSSSSSSSSAESLPAFARDLLAILSGAATVRFETGDVARTAAAVAALESAAGLPPQPPRPLSRL